MRLRESGKFVYGIGGVKTPEAFTKACDRFTYLEVLVGGPLSEVDGSAEADDPSASVSGAMAVPISESPADQLGDTTSTFSQPTSSPSDSTPSFPDIRDMLEPAIRATAKECGWSPLCTVGWSLVNNTPSFDSCIYGYPKLGGLVRDLDWVETIEMPDTSVFGHLWIRVVDASQ
jgi:OST-HTH/LOTUS domain